MSYSETSSDTLPPPLLLSLEKEMHGQTAKNTGIYLVCWYNNIILKATPFFLITNFLFVNCPSSIDSFSTGQRFVIRAKLSSSIHHIVKRLDIDNMRTASLIGITLVICLRSFCLAVKSNNYCKSMSKPFF